MRKYVILTALAMMLALLLVAMTAPPASAGIVNKGLETFPTNIYLPDNLIFYLGTNNDIEIYYDEATLDLLVIDAAAAAGGVYFGTGNVFIGAGTPGHTPDGNDAYITGFIEVDEEAYLDHGATIPADIELYLGLGYLEYVTADALIGVSVPLAVDGNITTTGTLASDSFAGGEVLVCTNADDELVECTGVTAAEAAYLATVTSNVQDQLDDKAPIDSPSFTTLVNLDYATVSEAVAVDASGNLVSVAGVSDTEVGYLADVTGAIQAQLNGKVDDPGAVADETICRWDGITGTAVQDSVLSISDGGDISSTANSIGFTTNSLSRKTAETYFSAVSATAFFAGPMISPIVASGLNTGAAHAGTTLGYLQVDDSADTIAFGFTAPELYTNGAAADFVFELEIDEQAAEVLDWDIVIYDDANTTAILTDVIQCANDGAKKYCGLVTAATGIGDLIAPGRSYIVTLSPVADGDDGNLYRARMTYSVGVQNDAS